jgi:dTMP kinase
LKRRWFDNESVSNWNALKSVSGIGIALRSVVTCGISFTGGDALTAAQASRRSNGYARLSGDDMPTRGKLIVIEGIDGSGKRTQLELLASAFAARGVAAAKVSFPNYGGFFGKLVGKFLNGEFGALDAVDPHFSALLYAGDRLEAKPTLEAALASGQMVIADRYIGSNLAHQGARVAREKRGEFIAWLAQLEYGIYGLPAEDLVIYLHLPVAEAHRLIAEKGARDYTKMQRDIQESNLAHLQAASEVYEELARERGWVKIECYESPHGTQTGAMRSPDAIHRDVLAAVKASILGGGRAETARGLRGEVPAASLRKS